MVYIIKYNVMFMHDCNAKPFDTCIDDFKFCNIVIVIT